MNPKVRLVLVSADIPYPPVSGGRVEVWRRIKALKRAGVGVGLICWFDRGRVAEPSPADMAALLEHCDWVETIPIERSPAEIGKRMSRIWRQPSHVASRHVTAPKRKLVDRCASYQPSAVFLDGLYGGGVARALSSTLAIPLLYRSHNIEHAYMRGQFAREGRIVRKLGLLANLVGLKRYERAVIRTSAAVFDISLTDRDYWESEGFRNVEWLPPSVDEDFAQRVSVAAPIDCDVLFFGNLNTPNNVEGVIWLVREVLPLLTDRALRIRLAGSRPVEAVRRLASSDSRINLIEDPVDMATLIRSARVLVNPVQAGSGVNIKAIEMLWSRAHLVSTSVGVGGLPDQVKGCFDVADTPEHFAASIVSALGASVPNLADRERVRAGFASSAMAERIAARAIDAGSSVGTR